MIARLGLLLMVTVDTVMIGRYDTSELAIYAISMAPHQFLLTIGIGLLVGTIVLTAQAKGAGREHQCGAIWHAGLMTAFILGLVECLVLQFGEHILLALNQTPTFASQGGEAMRWFGPGMPAIFIFIASSALLEGLGRPTPGMVVALLGNVANFVLNWRFIFGHLGAPEMGAAGANLATTLTRWLMAAVLIVYVLRLADRDALGLLGPLRKGIANIPPLLRLGIPISTGIGVESSSFMTLTSFAGRISADVLAAYQIIFNLLALAFMLAIGVSTATAVRVGNAIGRGDAAGVAVAGWVGTGLIFVVMALVAISLALFKGPIVAGYTDSEIIVALVGTVIFILIGLFVFDGVQAVLMGALRGAGDVVIPVIFQTIAFWGISVPLAYMLSIRGDEGMAGLLTGIMSGLITATLLLSLRFRYVSAKGNITV